MEAVGNGSPCRRGVREERKRAKIKPRLRYWGSEREKERGEGTSTLAKIGIKLEISSRLARR